MWDSNTHYTRVILVLLLNQFRVTIRFIAIYKWYYHVERAKLESDSLISHSITSLSNITNCIIGHIIHFFIHHKSDLRSLHQLLLLIMNQCDMIFVHLDVISFMNCFYSIEILVNLSSANSISWASIRWASIRWASIRWASIRWASISKGCWMIV